MFAGAIGIHTSDFLSPPPPPLLFFFCFSPSDSLSAFLYSLQLCAEDDVRLFTYLLPDVYTHVSLSPVVSSCLNI